jgi:putative acetyltransferase
MDTIEEIRHAARRLVRELHLLDGRHCIEGFSFSECHLVTELQMLGHATASELAETLVLEKSTVSRLVNGLIDKGQVRTSIDHHDRRKRLLSLTRDGQDGAQRVHRYARGQVENALAFVSNQERPALTAGLEGYARALRCARLASEYEIRPIDPGDIQAVAAIIRVVMTEFGAVGEGYSIEDPEVDDMFSAYQGPGSRFWVVERNGEVLGCAGFGPLAGGPPDTCELRKMYFLQDLRGLGLGTRLLNLCLDEAAVAGYRQCYLETLAAMDGARRLYLRNGFRPIDAPLGNTGHSACNAWMLIDLPAIPEPD